MIPKNAPPGSLPWPPLIKARLVRRYKRFLADAELDNGRIVTAHCPNSGAMTTCCEPGRTIYLSRHDSPKRKLKYTWEMIHMPTSLVGVNTLVPNRLVYSAIQHNVIAALDGYDSFRREVRTGDNSRIDIMLDSPDRAPCYIEIKNCTLLQDGVARFPDAVTLRGQKHLDELRRLADAKNRCVIFFLVQRMDANHFEPADTIDPAYGEKLRVAIAEGVEAMAFDVQIELAHIRIRQPLPIQLT